ncbi:MAG: CYTH domain-containing protein [Rhodospirillales bacterium]|jgi:CYTH domain-containing protein|nr:CYTH domain-containing protein [Rhodospirillales bacterium]
MGIEIERKFLVSGDGWRFGSHGLVIRQGYICSRQDTVVRVRTLGSDGFLTIKGDNSGIARAEFEYPIPAADAGAMLDRLCQRPLIEKTRYAVEYEGTGWVVDEFIGDNAGLIVAEVELDRVDQAVTLPPWVGREVTLDPRFFNVNLASRPFTRWPAAERAAIVS